MDRLEALNQIRVLLEDSIYEADIPQRAALARQLRETLKEIAELEAASVVVEDTVEAPVLSIARARAARAAKSGRR